MKDRNRSLGQFIALVQIAEEMLGGGDESLYTEEKFNAFFQDLGKYIPLYLERLEKLKPALHENHKEIFLAEVDNAYQEFDKLDLTGFVPDLKQILSAYQEQSQYYRGLYCQNPSNLLGQFVAISQIFEEACGGETHSKQFVTEQRRICVKNPQKFFLDTEDKLASFQGRMEGNRKETLVKELLRIYTAVNFHELNQLELEKAEFEAGYQLEMDWGKFVNP